MAVSSFIQKIPKILEECDKILTDAEKDLTIKGKTLEQANKENPSLYVYYSQKTSELKFVLSRMEAEVAAFRGEQYYEIKKKNPIDLNEREINKLIDYKEQYLTLHEIYLEVSEMYHKFQNLVDGINARGYALNNITKARVADVHGTEL